MPEDHPGSDGADEDGPPGREDSPSPPPEPESSGAVDGGGDDERSDPPRHDGDRDRSPSSDVDDPGERRGRIARLRAFVAAYPPHRALADAAHEHRWHTGLAAGLFAAGVIFGILLALAGVDLLEWFLEILEDELLPDDEEDPQLTARFFIVQNTQPFLLSILGAITVGLLTVLIMVFNGIVVGNIGFVIGQTVGFDYVLVGLAPHGIFELTALFVAAGVGFRILHRLAWRIVGWRDAFVTRRYLYRTFLLVVAAWLLLVLAAVIEAHVTPVLLETLFEARMAELAAAGNESAGNA